MRSLPWRSGVGYPWGTVRAGPNNALPTGYTFTGQLDSRPGFYYGLHYTMTRSARKHDFKR